MRSFLFIPGDSPKKLDKGMGSGADALLLDLEDSISPQNKAEARAMEMRESALMLSLGFTDPYSR